MPSRPAPFISRLRLLRTAVASPVSAQLPRLAIPAAPPVPRAFVAASPLVLRPVATRFAQFSMAAAASSAASSVHDFTVKDSSGKDVDLSTYKGKVLLIVNVASQCGLTNSNYTELSQLYEKYKDQGFEILAFPCNQFGGQEPGTNEEIVQFACTHFKAEYPIFDKVDVNGNDVAPIYKFLKTSKGSIFGDNIKWNFAKFLVDKEGRVVDRYAPTTSPLSIEIFLPLLVPSVTDASAPCFFSTGFSASGTPTAPRFGRGAARAGGSAACCAGRVAGRVGAFWRCGVEFIACAVEFIACASEIDACASL